MNLIITNQENFQIHLYTVLVQGISSIFVDQMSMYLAFFLIKKTGINIFTNLPPSVTVLKNDKAKFKAT